MCFTLSTFIYSAMIMNGCSRGHVYGEWGKDSKPKPGQDKANYKYKYTHKPKQNGPRPCTGPWVPS